MYRFVLMFSLEKCLWSVFSWSLYSMSLFNGWSGDKLLSGHLRWMLCSRLSAATHQLVKDQWWMEGWHLFCLSQVQKWLRWSNLWNDVGRRSPSTVEFVQIYNRGDDSRAEHLHWLYSFSFNSAECVGQWLGLLCDQRHYQWKTFSNGSRLSFHLR